MGAFRRQQSPEEFCSSWLADPVPRHRRRLRDGIVVLARSRAPPTSRRSPSFRRAPRDRKLISRRSSSAPSGKDAACARAAARSAGMPEPRYQLAYPVRRERDRCAAWSASTWKGRAEQLQDCHAQPAVGIVMARAAAAPCRPGSRRKGCALKLALDLVASLLDTAALQRQRNRLHHAAGGAAPAATAFALGVSQRQACSGARGLAFAAVRAAART
mgnify:CR=1 FL=1